VTVPSATAPRLMSICTMAHRGTRLKLRLQNAELSAEAPASRRLALSSQARTDLTPSRTPVLWWHARGCDGRPVI
jgi:hypothetical protein